MTYETSTHSAIRPAAAGWCAAFGAMELSPRVVVAISKHNRQLPQGCFPDA